ncbi:MAG: FAD/NAD(P)-binding protein [Bacillota bacterium]
MTDLETWYHLRFKSGLELGHDPGQFVQVSVFGVGVAPISVTSAPSMTDGFELCIRHVGNVTNAMRRMKAGDVVGIRGPFGRGFDAAAAEGMDLLFVAGGLGLVPLRSLINTVLDRREAYGRVIIFYGARSPDALLFREELGKWEDDPSVEYHVTVDVTDDTWRGNVGVVTTLFSRVTLNADRTAAFICGPDIMFRFVVQETERIGIPDEMIFLSLERRMKCGVGKCGHCQEGSAFVCRDGPCFSYAEIKEL